MRKCIKIFFATVTAIFLMSGSVICAADGQQYDGTLNIEESADDSGSEGEAVNDAGFEDVSGNTDKDETAKTDGGNADASSSDGSVNGGSDNASDGETSGSGNDGTDKTTATPTQEAESGNEETDSESGDSSELNEEDAENSGFVPAGIFTDVDLGLMEEGEVLLNVADTSQSDSTENLVAGTAEPALSVASVEYLTKVVYVNITETIFQPPAAYLGTSNFGTHAFYVDGQFAWCAIPDASPPPSTTATVESVSNEILEKLLYIAPGTSHFRGDVLNVLSGGICGTDGESQVFIYHMAIAKLMGYDMTGNTAIISPAGDALVDDLINWVITYQDAITVPSYLKTVVYKPLNTAEVNYQNIVVQYDMTFLNGTVTIFKTDENEDPLPGATFRIDSYNAASKSWDEFGFAKDNGDGTYTLDINYTEENKGYFRILESKAPTGYTRTKGYRYIRLTEDGQNITMGTTTRTGTEKVSLIWEDTPFTAHVTVKKNDTEGQPLAGAVFTVYEWSKAKSAWVKYGKMTDNSDGTYTMDATLSQDNLGKFRVRETKAPAGYNRDSSAYRYFTITSNNQKITKGTNAAGTVTYDLVWTDTKIVEEEPEPEKYSITIDKLIFSEDLLAGHGDPIFAFKIDGTDDRGNAIIMHRVISFEGENGQGEIMKSVTIDDLPTGSYTVTELETQRYSLVSIGAVTSNARAVIDESGIVKGGIETITGKAEIELTDSDAEVMFTNRKTDWSDYSDATLTENVLTQS